jgi:tRNA (cytidine/uridine-2'-O-)-methyltransferase
MRISISFYHPKNPQNLWDVAAIAEYLNANLYVIPRPSIDYKLDRLPESMRKKIRFLSNLAELKSYEPKAEYIVLETYGDKLITELSVSCGRDIVLIVGAEDYGIPPESLSVLDNYTVYLIPVAVEGMSYNVVTSIIMAIYEIFNACRTSNLKGGEGESLA